MALKIAASKVICYQVSFYPATKTAERLLQRPAVSEMRRKAPLLALLAAGLGTTLGAALASTLRTAFILRASGGKRLGRVGYRFGGSARFGVRHRTRILVGLIVLRHYQYSSFTRIDLFSPGASQVVPSEAVTL